MQDQITINAIRLALEDASHFEPNLPVGDQVVGPVSKLEDK